MTTEDLVTEYTPRTVYECVTCGALVADPQTHITWHATMRAAVL